MFLFTVLGSEHDFQLTTVTLADAGTYVCEATNDGGDRLSRTVRVNVERKLLSD